MAWGLEEWRDVLQKNEKLICHSLFDGELVESLQKMRELAKILSKNRYLRGSLDFDTKEAKILLNNYRLQNPTQEARLHTSRIEFLFAFR